MYWRGLGISCYFKHYSCFHLHLAVLLVKVCLVPPGSWISDSLRDLCTLQSISVDMSYFRPVNAFSPKCFGIRGVVGSCSSSLPVLFPESFPLELPDSCQRAPVWHRLPLGNASPSWLLTHTNRQKEATGEDREILFLFPFSTLRKR